MKPLEAFEDSFRLADLMIHLYRLLENEGITREGRLVEEFRRVLGCDQKEELQLIANAVFLGCIRESANIPSAQLRRQSLENLLRQAVVSAATAYEVFLSRTLQIHLPTAIQWSRSQAIPQSSPAANYFKDLTVPIEEVLNLLDRDDRWASIAQKIYNYVKSRNLGSVEAMSTVGALLGVPDAWERICDHLGRDRKATQELVRGALKRRNAIVHSGDRDRDSIALEKTPIHLPWTQQAVDTIKHVCLAFDQVVQEHMEQLRANLAARQMEETHA